jgi:hypothetical protein
MWMEGPRRLRPPIAWLQERQPDQQGCLPPLERGSGRNRGATARGGGWQWMATQTGACRYENTMIKAAVPYQSPRLFMSCHPCLIGSQLYLVFFADLVTPASRVLSLFLSPSEAMIRCCPTSGFYSFLVRRYVAASVAKVCETFFHRSLGPQCLSHTRAVGRSRRHNCFKIGVLVRYSWYLELRAYQQRGSSPFDVISPVIVQTFSAKVWFAHRVLQNSSTTSPARACHDTHSSASPNGASQGDHSGLFSANKQCCPVARGDSIAFYNPVAWECR